MQQYFPDDDRSNGELEPLLEPKLISPEAPGPSFFEVDFQNYTAMMEMIAESEQKVDSTELVEKGLVLQTNTDHVALDWSHIMASILQRKGFTIAFSHDAYMASFYGEKSKLLPDLTSVYTLPEQTLKIEKISEHLINDGGHTFRLVSDASAGEIRTSGLDSRGILARFMKKHRIQIGANEVAEFANQPRTDEADIKFPDMPYEDLVALTSRAFLTAQLRHQYDADRYQKRNNEQMYWADKEAARKAYERMREEGITPMGPEELFGMMEALVDYILDQHPELRADATPKES